MNDASLPLPPTALLMQLITGKWVSQAISAAANLDLAAHLAGGPKMPAELARDADAHAPSLLRLLRALASVGVFVEDDAGRFSNTPLSALLRSDVPGSMRGMARFVATHGTWAPWGELTRSVRTGEAAFDHLFGEHFFSYAAKQPAFSAIFNEAMTSLSTAVSEAVVDAVDFSSVATLVDIAGGHGALLASILQRHPGARGILFDLPGVTAGARPLLEGAGVASRVEIVSGDFFKAVPSGAQGYLLKHILHDWDDERALQILEAIHRAAPPGARLFIVEAVITAGNAPDLGKLLDLEMLVLTPGGRERTVKEYEALFTAARFKLTRLIPTASHMSVLEATRV